MNRRTRAKDVVVDSGEAAPVDMKSVPSKNSTRSRAIKAADVIQKEVSTPKRTTRRTVSAASSETNEPKAKPSKRNIVEANNEESTTKRSRRGQTRAESTDQEPSTTKLSQKKKSTKKDDKVESTTNMKEVPTTSRRATRKNQSQQESAPEEIETVKSENKNEKTFKSTSRSRKVVEEPIKKNSVPAEPLEAKKLLRTRGKKAEQVSEPMEVDEPHSVEVPTPQVQSRVKSRARAQSKTSESKAETEINSIKTEAKVSKTKKAAPAEEVKEVKVEQKTAVSGRALRAQRRATNLDIEPVKSQPVEKKRAPKKTPATKPAAKKNDVVENVEVSTSNSETKDEPNSKDVMNNEALPSEKSTIELSIDKKTKINGKNENMSSGFASDNVDITGLNPVLNGSTNVKDTIVNGVSAMEIYDKEDESAKKRKLEFEELGVGKRARIDSFYGDLFTFGDPLSHELGPRQVKFLDRKARKFEPALVKLSSKVRTVACGALHSVVVTEKGSVISFGVNDDGPLGRSTTREDNPDISDDSECDDYDDKVSGLPLPVKGLENVIKVTAGDMHSVALRDDGKAFIWGNFKDESHKIGLFPDDRCTGSNYFATLLPRQIELEEKIIDIASGSHHVLLLTEKGQVYSFGEGSQGQLGRILSSELNTIATARDLFLKPELVDIDKPIKRIFASQWCSFALADGVVYGWGLNNYHQLGFRSTTPIQTDDLLQVLKPEQVPCSSLKIAQVANGQQHTLFLDTEGSVYSCGSVLYGKLGHGNELVNSCGDAQAISYLKKIEQTHFGSENVIEIACGDFCSMAITQSGKLYAWGQASHIIGSPDEDRFEPHLIGGPFAENAEFFTLSAGSAFAAVIGILNTPSA